jgi:Transposase IS200 like
MDDYESLSHTKWECKYHVVFIPKCRRKTLYRELRRHLGEVFRRLAVQKESRIEEGHLMPDHVHMMISIPPKYAVSQVVGPIIKAPGSAGGYLPRLIAVSPGRPGRRRDHPWLGAAVHRVGFAIAAVARDRGHALLASEDSCASRASCGAMS